MAHAMQHWNGSMMCSIDIETTGDDPAWHEIWQIAILPLDSNIKPRQDLTPLNILIQPSGGPESWNPEVLAKMSKKQLSMLADYGLDRETGVQSLIEWHERLPLPLTSKGGFRTKVIPLGHNYKFDFHFLISLLGAKLYYDLFHPRHRCTMVDSLFMNDIAGMGGKTVPYSKNNLQWLCNQRGISNEGAHDALIDCNRTAQLYRAMLLDHAYKLRE